MHRDYYAQMDLCKGLLLVACRSSVKVLGEARSASRGGAIPRYCMASVGEAQ